VEFEEGTPVLVKYPAPGMTHLTPRETWPWMPGVIEEVCGPDEWLVAVEDRSVATTEDGSAAPDNADDADVWFPMCFRDHTEIQAVAA